MSSVTERQATDHIAKLRSSNASQAAVRRVTDTYKPENSLPRVVTPEESSRKVHGSVRPQEV